MTFVAPTGSAGYQTFRAFDETRTNAAAVWRDLLPAVKKLTSRKQEETESQAKEFKQNAIYGEYKFNHSIRTMFQYMNHVLVRLLISY